MAKVRLDKKGRQLHTGEYQNPDGRYVYHYTDKNGKKCKVYSWCLNSTDKPPKGRKCDKCLRVLEAEITEDKTKGIDTQTAKKRTLDEQFEIFIDNKKTKIKKNTLTNYKYMYKKFIQPYFGKRKINTILYSEVNKYYQDLLTKQHFKVSTLENIHTILYPLFKLAIKDDIITKNPCEDLIAEYKTDKRQIGKSTIRHSFTKQQQDSFLGFVKDNIDKYERWYNLLVFFIGTACRISEVCALTWDDVDFTKNQITINHQLDYGVNEQGKFEKRIETPKSKAGYRTIPINPDVKTVLLEEWQRQKNNGLVCLDTISGVKVIDKDGNTAECSLTGFVFLNRFGNCLLPNSTNKAFERIRIAYNEYERQLAEKEHREPQELPHFSNHHLRHTGCTRFCENVDDIAAIGSVMGHTDIKTTANIYNEVHDQHKQNVFGAAWDKLKIG